MTESIPRTVVEIRPLFTLEETQQLQRSLTQKVLDKAANDPRWKQQLLDDPEAAMREANFPETQKINQRMQEGAKPWLEEAEVTGQSHCWTPVTYSCEWFTFYWSKQYGETLCSISQA